MARFGGQQIGQRRKPKRANAPAIRGGISAESKGQST
jgi:hypothetical protein